MSADNWANCPRCTKKREDDFAEREASVAASYGTIPVDEFDRARERLAIDKAERFVKTFREDYEIYGADEGEVTVEYRGSCHMCGLSLKFSDTHPLHMDQSA